jgi:hypothetical protein
LILSLLRRSPLGLIVKFRPCWCVVQASQVTVDCLHRCAVCQINQELKKKGIITNRFYYRAPREIWQESLNIYAYIVKISRIYIVALSNKILQFLLYGRSIGSWICLTHKTYTCHTIHNTIRYIRFTGMKVGYTIFERVTMYNNAKRKLRKLQSFISTVILL